MAKKFRFRLGRVEQIRRRERDAKRRELAGALAEVVGVQQRIERTSGALRETVEGSRHAGSAGGVDMTEMRGHQYYRGVLQRRLLEDAQTLADRQAVVQGVRQELAQATGRLRVIEKLRDRALLRHHKDLQREELAATNEIATTAYIRLRNQDKSVMPS